MVSIFRILVTHSVTFLAEMDEVVVMVSVLLNFFHSLPNKLGCFVLGKPFSFIQHLTGKDKSLSKRRTQEGLRMNSLLYLFFTNGVSVIKILSFIAK
jgi:hypothetical protein